MPASGTGTEHEVWENLERRFLFPARRMAMGEEQGMSLWRIPFIRLATQFVALLYLLSGLPALAQEQDSETKALDATATQWSFQFAYQWMPDYYDDILSSGEPRPAGSDNYVQLRIVAPLPFKPLTVLPRLTVRHYENREGEAGFGNTELFALLIPRQLDWGLGRAGIGPLVTLPGDPDVSRDEWGYGLAGAIVNTSGKLFYGALLTQSWRGIDPLALPPGNSNTNPLGIAPFLNYRLGKGYYVGNGDMVILYDWNSNEWLVPIGIRLGKVFVTDSAKTWNFYMEYQTSAIYKSYPGPAVENSFRVNLTYAIPVNL